MVHFEIHADDPDRARSFYAQVFGWSFSKWDGSMEYWAIRTGEESEPGINGGLVRRMGPRPGGMQPVGSFVCTVDIPDLDATVATVAQAGGSMVVPKMPIPGVGWLAYAKDTEGNILGLMQADPSAGG